jgi:hypothetical protein
MVERPVGIERPSALGGKDKPAQRNTNPANAQQIHQISTLFV